MTTFTSARLQHFRSYSDSAFEFGAGVNIVVGPNASGKTNLLESVLVASRGGSYRVADADLVAFDQPWARIDIGLSDDSERIVKIVKEPKPGKSYDIAGKPYRRLPAAQQLPVVLFEPNHLSLLNGPPDGRRSYLDDLLEQTIPSYQLLRQQYARCLRQRNALLKRGPASQSQLFAWDVRLSQLAGQVVRARSDLVARMQQDITSLYNNLSHTSTEVQVAYAARFTPDQYESQLLKKLEADRDLDLARGFTGAGPHREDLLVTYNNHPAAETASRGEIRTAVLALKILELRLLQDVTGRQPLLLLDDVFSELDGSRRKLLTTYIEKYQSFITTTDADIVVQHFSDTCTVLPTQR